VAQRQQLSAIGMNRQFIKPDAVTGKTTKRESREIAN
jgi:hypothetical protein